MLPGEPENVHLYAKCGTCVQLKILAELAVARSVMLLQLCEIRPVLAAVLSDSSISNTLPVYRR